jgi:hypothetical protein
MGPMSEQPGPTPPPVYPPPPAEPNQQQPGTPPPVLPTAPAGAGAAGIIRQFTGNAGWSLLLGVVTIAVPFIFNRVFFFLPIIGFVAGILAIRRGQLIGGIVGLVLNAIGGLITAFALLAG